MTTKRAGNGDGRATAKTKAKYRDLSTALLTMRPWAASVEMTLVCGGFEEGTAIARNNGRNNGRSNGRRNGRRDGRSRSLRDYKQRDKNGNCNGKDKYGDPSLRSGWRRKVQDDDVKQLRINRVSLVVLGQVLRGPCQGILQIDGALFLRRWVNSSAWLYLSGSIGLRRGFHGCSMEFFSGEGGHPAVGKGYEDTISQTGHLYDLRCFSHETTPKGYTVWDSGRGVGLAVDSRQ
jgi:hypothetical protein